MKRVKLKIVHLGRVGCGLVLFPAKRLFINLALPGSFGFQEIEERAVDYCTRRGFQFLYCEVLR